MDAKGTLADTTIRCASQALKIGANASPFLPFLPSSKGLFHFISIFPFYWARGEAPDGCYVLKVVFLLCLGNLPARATQLPLVQHAARDFDRASAVCIVVDSDRTRNSAAPMARLTHGGQNNHRATLAMP